MKHRSLSAVYFQPVGIIAMSVVGLVIWLAFFWHLGDTGLIDETEPLFAEAARQMQETGDWITPYFNGAVRFDKPPLIYWLMAIAYRIFGVNEWAVRLPSAIAASILTVAVFVTLTRWGFSLPQTSMVRKNSTQLIVVGLMGACLTALNLHSLIWGRMGVSDMLLSACIGLSLLCFFWGYASQPDSSMTSNNTRLRLGRGKSRWQLPDRWYVACYVFISLAVLAKGPVGLVLPSAIIGFFLLYIGKLGQVWRQMRPIWGLIIIAVLTFPWFILITLEHGSLYTEEFFEYHNIERFTSVVNNHSGPWYFYFLVLLVLFAPYSAYLPQAIVSIKFWQPYCWRQQPRSHHLKLFALCWFAVVFVFFSVAVTKLPSYVLPLIPAAAILVALLWSEMTTPCLEATNVNQTKHSGLRWSGYFNVLLLFALATACLIAPQIIGRDPIVGKEFNDLLSETGIPIRGAILWGVAAAVANFCLVFRLGWQWLIATNLIAYLLSLIILINPAIEFVDDVRQAPIRDIADTLIEVQQPQEEIWMIGFSQPSIVFYSQKSVKFFKNQDRVLEYIQTNPNFSNNSILIVSQSRYLERLGLEEEDYQQLDKEDDYRLVRVNQPKILDKIVENSFK